MFLRRPSPLLFKVRSKIAELYLLTKKDIFSISKSYKNIWGKIYKKDFHNMISIKHQTFQILNKYIEMNGFGKINPIDMSKNYILDDNEVLKQSQKSLSINNNPVQSFFAQNISKKKYSSKTQLNNSKFLIKKNT